MLGTFSIKKLVWSPFAILWGVLGGWGPNGSLNPWFWGPLGLTFGFLSDEISSPFLMKKLGCFLHAFCLPKWFQMPPKMKPKLTQISICFRLRSHTVFTVAFGKLFGRFPRRPTFDLTAIYNVFVGLSLCPKIQKSSQNDQPKWCRGAPKTTPKPSKKHSKN